MTFKQITDPEMKDTTIFVCACHQPHHIMRIWDFGDGEPLGVEIALNPQYGFFRRTWAALRYVFRRSGWQFADVILNPEDVIELRHVLQTHIQGIKVKD